MVRAFYLNEKSILITLNDGHKFSKKCIGLLSEWLRDYCFGKFRMTISGTKIKVTLYHRKDIKCNDEEGVKTIEHDMNIILKDSLVQIGTNLVGA